MSDDEQDDELNVLSENFDALSALYSNKIVVPWEKAPVLDNVAKYEHFAKKSDGVVSLDKVASKSILEVKKKKENEKLAQVPVERKLPLLPVPEPVKEESEEDEDEQVYQPSRKRYENVLTLIDKAEGPLGFLKDCMHHRVRVKVWTRNYATIRGYSQGFVVAFDKHWNIAMEDVTEVWTRKIKRKTVPMGIASEPPPEWTARGPPLVPPPLEILSKDKKTETCRRHLDQIFIRGEHVVMVSVISS